MGDEVLRMRATVVTDEAITSLRALGKQLGLTGKNVDLRQPQKQMGAFKETIVTLTRELKLAAPSLSTVGFTAAGIAASVIGATRGFKTMADRMVELKLASRELGLSQREIRAFQLAAEKASIAPEALNSALQTFTANALDIKVGFTNLRGELRQLGAGDLVAAIANSTNTLDGLHAAFIKLKDLGEKNPQLARMLSGQIFGNPEIWRMDWAEVEEALRKQGEITAENEVAAKRYRDAVIEVNKAWQDVKEGMMTGMAGQMLGGLLTDLGKVLESIKAIQDWIDKKTGAEPNMKVPPGLSGLEQRMQREWKNTETPPEVGKGGGWKWLQDLFKPKAGPTAQMGALTPGVSAMAALVSSTDISGRSRLQNLVAAGLDKYQSAVDWVNASPVNPAIKSQSELYKLHQQIKPPDIESILDQMIPVNPLLFMKHAAQQFVGKEDRKDEIKEGTKAGVLAALEEYDAMQGGGGGGVGLYGAEGIGGGRGRRGLASRLGMNTAGGVGGGDPGVASAKNMTASQKDVAGIVNEEWSKAGMSKTGIAGLMANIRDESGFDPNLRHPDQPRWGGEAHFAHGLYQEGGQEWLNYKKWLDEKHPGANWKDPKLQSEFAAFNLRKNYPGTWKRMNEAGSAGEAAAIYVNEYLKPRADYAAQRTAKYRRGVPGVDAYLGNRVDQQITGGGGNVTATGTVNVNVHAPKGTKVAADSDGLWQETTVRNYRQMQPTETAGHGASGGW